MSNPELFGLIAGVLSFLGYFTYIWSILQKRTRPNRVTWWVLSLSSFVLLASYYAIGAQSSLWVAVGYAAGNTIIAILSIRYGYGQWGTVDKVSLGAALASIVVWVFFSTPFLALIINIAVDFFGILPTLYKTYLKPLTESRVAWTLSSLASVFAVMAIDQWTLAVAIYPIYLLIANSSIAALSFRTETTVEAKQL